MATTYYVSTTGSNSNNGTSESTAFRTIPYAINFAAAGSTIRVLAGTYTDNFDISKNNITLLGPNENKNGNAPDRVSEAILSNVRCTIRLTGAVINGFKISHTTNVAAPNNAVFDITTASTSTGPTIRSCLFERNATESAGNTQIGIRTSNTVNNYNFINNLFTGSTSDYTETNNLSWNTGIYIITTTSRTGTITNNAFEKCLTNINFDGSCTTASVTLANNIFSNSGTFMSFGAASAVAVASGPTVQNNIFNLTPTSTPALPYNFVYDISVNTSFRLNIFDNSFNFGSGNIASSDLTLDQKFSIERLMVHKGRSFGGRVRNGIVYYCQNEQCTIAGLTTIANALFYAPSTNPSNTVYVEAGTYTNANMTLNKSIKFIGPNVGKEGNAADRVPEAILQNYSTTITGANATMDGFTFLNTLDVAGGVSVNYGTLNLQAQNTTIQNNIFYRNPPSKTHSPHAIQINAATPTPTFIIKNNLITSVEYIDFSLNSSRAWRSAIYINGSTTQIASASNNLFEKVGTCIVVDNSTSQNLAIQNNTFSYSGTYISFGGSAASSPKVENNTFNISDSIALPGLFINNSTVTNNFRLNVYGNNFKFGNDTLTSQQLSLEQKFNIENITLHKGRNYFGRLRNGIVYYCQNEQCVLSGPIIVGVNIPSTISDAIFYAPSTNPSDTIYVKDGPYNLTSSLNINKSVTLLGPNYNNPAAIGNGTPQIRLTEATIVLPSDASCIYIQASNLTIKGFTLQNTDRTIIVNGSTSYANVTISNNIVNKTGVSNEMFQFSGSGTYTGWGILNNIFQGNYSNGCISLNNLFENITIQYNNFMGTGDGAIIGNPKNLTLDTNYFNQSNSPNIYCNGLLTPTIINNTYLVNGYGLQLTTSGVSQIKNNSITGITPILSDGFYYLRGIDILGTAFGGTDADGLVIINNTFTNFTDLIDPTRLDNPNNQYRGVHILQGTSGVVIRNNDFINCHTVLGVVGDSPEPTNIETSSNEFNSIILGLRNLATTALPGVFFPISNNPPPPGYLGNNYIMEGLYYTGETTSETGSTQYLDNPILVQADTGLPEVSTLAVIIANLPYPSNSGVTYAENTGYAGSVTKITINAVDNDGNPITNFSSKPLLLTLTLPNANPENTPLQMFKLNANGTKMNPQPVGYPANVNYLPGSGDEWSTTLLSLSDYLIEDPLAGIISTFYYSNNTSSTSASGTITSSSYAIPEGASLIGASLGNVTSIGANAFQGTNLTGSFIIPDSVTSIGASAFASCTGITSLNIGAGVVTLGDSCFLNIPISNIFFQSPNTITSVGVTIFNSPAGPVTPPPAVTYYYAPDETYIQNGVLLIKNTYFTDPGTTFTYQATCFNEGTKILCMENGVEKWINVEELTIDSLVKTYLHGYKRVKRIGKGSAMNNAKEFNCCMYKLKKESYPELFEDLILMGGHSIMVDEIQINRFEKQELNMINFHESIDDKKLVPVGLSSIFKKAFGKNQYNYYNFALESETGDQRFGIYANGILCETPSVYSFDKYCSKGFHKIWKGLELISQVVPDAI